MTKAATARTSVKRPTGGTLRARTITPENREIRRWLEDWMKTPPVENEAFWREFKRELRENRFNVRKEK